MFDLVFLGRVWNVEVLCSLERKFIEFFKTHPTSVFSSLLKPFTEVNKSLSHFPSEMGAGGRREGLGTSETMLGTSKTRLGTSEKMLKTCEMHLIKDC